MSDNKFTDQELDICRSTDMAALAESLGYTVTHHHKWQTLKEAQHIVIKQNTRYYDNYKKEWGDAVTFVQEHKNLSFPEAVEFLLAFNDQARDQPVKQAPKVVHQEKSAPAEFTLPAPNDEYKKVFSYLRKRGIAYQVIKNFADAGLLYEDKDHHNCVFVGKDADGKAVFAFKRGTYDRDGVGFKGDVDGSNKDIAFRLSCDPSLDMVRVYESPIDLMSDMTMRRFITSNCVALCCLGDNALETYLKENPHIKRIDLCLDSDKWGREAAERMKEKYEKSGYEVRDFTPPKGKDWNEYLQIKNEKKRERSDAR